MIYNFLQFFSHLNPNPKMLVNFIGCCFVHFDSFLQEVKNSLNWFYNPFFMLLLLRFALMGLSINSGVVCVNSIFLFYLVTLMEDFRWVISDKSIFFLFIFHLLYFFLEELLQMRSKLFFFVWVQRPTKHGFKVYLRKYYT